MIPAGNPGTAGDRTVTPLDSLPYLHLGPSATTDARTLAVLDPLSYFQHHTAALTPRQRDLVRCSVLGACAAMADGAGVLDAASWKAAVDEAVERWGKS